MGKTLYVGNISAEAIENDIKTSFSTIGEVESVKIITDAYTGQPKGFCFIEMESEEDAKKAIADLNGSTFMEKKIVVNEARPQKPRERAGAAGRGGNFNRSSRGYERNMDSGYRKERKDPGLEVKVYGNNIENALRDLKNKLQKEGIFKELKKRRYYEKPSVKEKNKRIEAIKKKIKASKFKR